MTEPEYKAWISTYGLLTADRILSRFNIRLSTEELTQALNQKNNPYYILLRVPLKNIFNGIILQQANDYHVYVQKLLIDYRLSNEYSKDPESAGKNIRDDLNTVFDEVSDLIKLLTAQKTKHFRLISESQAWLIDYVKESKKLKKGADAILKDPLFTEKYDKYSRSTDENSSILRGYRGQFQAFILRTTEMINLLSDYHLDLDQEIENRELLIFDPNIGEFGELK